MEIKQISLENFRNYETEKLEFDPGINLIVGKNAQGKTNLLEAVHYLSTGHGFRTRKEAELIRLGAEYAQIEAAVQTKEREQTFRIVLFSGRKKRQLYAGGVKEKTFTGMEHRLTTVLFCPEDLLILKQGSSGRRKLLDRAICQLRPAYERTLAEYQKVLEQKSTVLKKYREEPSYLDLLPEYNSQLARLGAIIIKYRAEYTEMLAEYTARYHLEFSDWQERMKLQYLTVTNVQNPKASLDEITHLLLIHQKAHEHAELATGLCLSGPHKDDFDVILNERNLRMFGSQGQVRTAAISLKLAERKIFLTDTGEEPVLLLDDVLSELDERRKDFILNRITTGQVLITSCERDCLPKAGKTVTVTGGTVADL